MLRNGSSKPQLPELQGRHRYVIEFMHHCVPRKGASTIILQHRSSNRHPKPKSYPHPNQPRLTYIWSWSAVRTSTIQAPLYSPKHLRIQNPQTPKAYTLNSASIPRRPNHPLLYIKYPLLRTIRAPLKGHWGALVLVSYILEPES